MINRLCTWFGFAAGSWVGLLMGLLYNAAPAASPSWPPLALDGLLIALITLGIGAVLACLLTRLSPFAVFALAILIAAPAGLVLGPVAFFIKDPLLALIISGILGLLFGQLVCRLLCRGGSVLNLEGHR
jgi:hypothetical protein